jgi:hypothetical protein
MTHLQHSRVRTRKLDEFARLGGAVGHRLLDEHVGALGKKVARDRKVRGRGSDDAHDVNGAEKLAVIRKRPALEFPQRRSRATARTSTTATSSHPGACAYFWA